MMKNDASDSPVEQSPTIAHQKSAVPSFYGGCLMAIILFIVLTMFWSSLLSLMCRGLSSAAKRTRISGDFTSLTAALDMYKEKCGDYPSSADGLKALVERPASLPPAVPWTRLADEVPLDPWGSEYAYAYGPNHGKKPIMSSLGPDTKQGTRDDIIQGSMQAAEDASYEDSTWKRIHRHLFEFSVLLIPPALISGLWWLSYRIQKKARAEVPPRRQG